MQAFARTGSGEAYVRHVPVAAINAVISFSAPQGLFGRADDIDQTCLVIYQKREWTTLNPHAQRGKKTGVISLQQVNIPTKE